MVAHLRPEWSDVLAYFAAMPVADGIAIHHTASVPAMRTFDPEYLRRIEHAEMANGYNALAYHSMFMLDGDSAEARPYGAMGAATGGHNGHTIAFCVPGYFHEPYFDQPTDALLRAMAEEIKVLKYLGFLTPNPLVRPHTWWTAGTQWATACCGSQLIPWVAAVETMSYDSWSPAPAPEPEKKQGGIPDVVIGWIIWQDVNHSYLISSTGRVLREFPQEDLVDKAYGSFPKAALESGIPRFRLTGDEWKSIIEHGALPNAA